MRRRPLLLLLLLLLLVPLACAPKRPDIEIHNPYSYESVLGNVGVVYFAIENRGPVADSLADVEVTGALVAMIHEQVANGAMVEMRHLGVLPVPPRSTVVLAPGGLHVMTEGLDHAPAAGDTLEVRLRFALSGELTFKAPVLAYGVEP